jgi:hypothetical protein
LQTVHGLYTSALTACNLHQLWYLGLSCRFEKFQAISTHLLSATKKLQQLVSGQQQVDTMNDKIMMGTINNIGMNNPIVPGFLI